MFRHAAALLAPTRARVVAEGGSGEEVLAIAEAQPAVDLVCMDIAMPGMDGIEATAACSPANHPALRVIGLSAFADPPVRDRPARRRHRAGLHHQGEAGDELLRAIPHRVRGAQLPVPEVAATVADALRDNPGVYAPRLARCLRAPGCCS